VITRFRERREYAKTHFLSLTTNDFSLEPTFGICTSRARELAQAQSKRTESLTARALELN
jgi:hypothetical protein